MAIEKVDFIVRAYDKYIEIIPKDGVKDNSIYEIKLKGIRALNSREDLIETDYKFITAMNPMYCSLMDVESLMDIVEIPKDIVLYNIREASKYARYVYDSYNYENFNNKRIPYAIKEFTRYKAAKDCLLKVYMALVTDNLIEGSLGDITWKTRDKVPDIKKLLQYLDEEIAKWLDAIRGYEFEGRARPKTAVKHSSPIARLTKPIDLGMSRRVL